MGAVSEAMLNVKMFVDLKELPLPFYGLQARFGCESEVGMIYLNKRESRQ
jgi:hypothetical protein